MTGTIGANIVVVVAAAVVVVLIVVAVAVAAVEVAVAAVEVAIAAVEIVVKVVPVVVVVVVVVVVWPCPLTPGFRSKSKLLTISQIQMQHCNNGSSNILVFSQFRPTYYLTLGTYNFVPTCTLELIKDKCTVRVYGIQNSLLYIFYQNIHKATSFLFNPSGSFPIT